MVWSDEWGAYNRVGSLPNVSSHGVVNHCLEFVNRATAMGSTPKISSPTGIKSKSSSRECVAAMSTSLRATLTSLCAGRTANQLFNIMLDIAAQYPVLLIAGAIQPVLQSCYSLMNTTGAKPSALSDL